MPPCSSLSRKCHFRRYRREEAWPRAEDQRDAQPSELWTLLKVEKDKAKLL